jgi:hypothetical protein
LREQNLVKKCTCPHCGKAIEVVFHTDFNYSRDFWVRAPIGKELKDNIKTAV